ncbi:MAG: hypothetical protein ACFFHV_08290 [Promethearchaeota archaeon]
MKIPLKKRRTTVRKLLFIFIVLNIFIPLLLNGLNNTTSPNFTNSSSNDNQGILKTQIFSKDDYEAILEEEKQALGDINVTDLIYNELGINYSNSMKSNYEDYKDDLFSGALNMSYKGTQFEKTNKLAQVDNINEQITDYKKITVLLNESISVAYNSSIQSLEGYLLYAPRLNPFLDAQIWVENNTGLPLQQVNKGNYSIIKIVNIVDINFLKFNYKDYFGYNSLNFTMHILWEYNFTIENWKLTQESGQELLLNEDENNIIKPNFDYQFKIIGNKFNKYGNATILADNLEVNLTINLPDKGLLKNIKFRINSDAQKDFLTPDNSIFVRGQLIKANGSLIEIEFYASYRILFEDPVKETWAIDRLVEDTNIRERIYFPYISSGPSHIYIKDAKVTEKTVSFAQVISASSLFGRSVFYEEVNATEFKEDVKYSLIFNENTTKKAGIKITLPYLVKGEICPFTIKYETNLDLRIKVTDNIRMPVAGLDVKIYYYGELYGTYISNEKNQPIGKTITDENGEIFIKNVPNGNYTIKIYQGENLIKEAEVSAYVEINYVTTPIFHIPFVVMIFSSISGLFFGIGYYIFRKQKLN